MGPPEGWEPPPPPAEGDFVDASCRWLNNAMEQTVVPPLRKYTQVRQSGEPQGDFWSTVTSPPQVPGLSRPVWLTIAASVPTALGWYGWYKFSVEEELFFRLLFFGRLLHFCGPAVAYPLAAMQFAADALDSDRIASLIA
jgi:hypothetical protein